MNPDSQSEEQHLEDFYIPTRKMYTGNGVLLGSIIGGPLVGTYMIAENFKTLKEPRLVTQSWVIGVLTTIAIGLFFSLPALEEVVPVFVPSLLLAIGARQAFAYFQQASVDTHSANGGQVFSNARSALVGLAGFAIQMALMIAILSFSGEIPA
ncbi:MAG: hypothetical protein NWR72_01795 [Bacteroidia bacterium]|nr:hypothetical protein [Bacteroidia bacterium]